MTDVVIPEDMWDDDSEGAISAWFYENGSQVDAGVVIAEIMNEKVSAELIAPVAGTLVILISAESAVNRGQIVARIDA